MTNNRTYKGSLFTTIILTSLLIIFSVRASATETKQTERDWVRFFDMRKDKNEKPIPLAEIEAVAVRASDEANGLVIVSYTDDETTKTYYEYAQTAKDEGKPIVAFLRAPEDGRNSFIIYADGRFYSLEKLFNRPSELVAGIDHATKAIQSGTTKRSATEKDANDDASLSPNKEPRRFKLQGAGDNEHNKKVDSEKPVSFGDIKPTEHHLQRNKTSLVKYPLLVKDAAIKTTENPKARWAYNTNSEKLCSIAEAVPSPGNIGTMDIFYIVNAWLGKDKKGLHPYTMIKPHTTHYPSSNIMEKIELLHDHELESDVRLKTLRSVTGKPKQRWYEVIVIMKPDDNATKAPDNFLGCRFSLKNNSEFLSMITPEIKINGKQVVAKCSWILDSAAVKKLSNVKSFNVELLFTVTGGKKSKPVSLHDTTIYLETPNVVKDAERTNFIAVIEAFNAKQCKL